MELIKPAILESVLCIGAAIAHNTANKTAEPINSPIAQPMLLLNSSNAEAMMPTTRTKIARVSIAGPAHLANVERAAPTAVLPVLPGTCAIAIGTDNNNKLKLETNRFIAYLLVINISRDMAKSQEMCVR